MQYIREKYTTLVNIEPVFSLSNNCTAGYSSIHDNLFYWAAIPCDEPIDAAFVCQKKSPVDHNTLSWSSDASNTMCDDGWVLMANSKRCYLHISNIKLLSFIDAQNKCLKENSSVLSISDNFGEYSDIDNQFVFDMIKQSFEIVEGKVPSDLAGEKVNDIMFGKLLKASEPANEMPAILPLVLTEVPRITLFAFIGSYCGIIHYDYSFNSNFLHQDISEDYLRAWEAKYRSCSKLLLSDVLICEKPSKIIILKHCGQGYFECKDLTCILLSYKCDHVVDCFDKSDEINCTSSLNGSITNQTIYIPCQLNKDCLTYDSQSTVFIHHICDGMLSPKIFVKEEYSCQYSILRTINLLDMTSQVLKGGFSKLEYNLIRIYQNEKAYGIPQIPAPFSFTFKTNAIETGYQRGKVLCYNKERVYLDERCKISSHHAPCNHGFTKQICRHILCPGMFKCKDYYCLQMSAVCDGQKDCLNGDDELFCNSLFCPGFLKCHGENRCVGNEEICDGHIDCIYSHDDEVLCRTYTGDCEIEGYILSCPSDNSINGIVFSKGFVITSNHSTLSINPLYLQYILYISASSCSIQNITYTIQSHLLSQRLLFANFSTNKINSVSFVAHNIFYNILTLDLSMNLLVHINFKLRKLKHIIVLYIKNNPIHSIELGNKIYNMKLMDLREIYYKVYISIEIPGKCDVIVSDVTLCCILPSIATCKSDNVYLCFGLFSDNGTKYSSYVLVVICFLIYILQVLKILYDKPWVGSNKKYYIITKCSHILADLFAILYFLTILVADIIQVNNILWSKALFCVFLRTLIATAIETSLIFKSMAITIICLKIIYPFKHQLRWLKVVPTAIIIMWLIIVALNVYDLVRFSSDDDGETHIDQFCTSFDCSEELTAVIISTTCVNIGCILLVCATLCITYFNLKKKEKTRVASTKTISIARVVSRMIKPFLFEISFRIIAVSVYMTKLILLHFPMKICLSLFLSMVPINIIVSSVLNMFKLWYYYSVHW